MSIFGISYPAISCSLGEVDLEHSKIEKTEFILSKAVIHESVLTGVRHVINPKSKSLFGITVLLNNYNNPEDIYNKLLTIKNERIYFWLHKDGNLMLDENLNNATFKFKVFKPYYLTQDKFYDSLYFEIESERYTRVTATGPGLGYGYSYGYNYGIGY